MTDTEAPSLLPTDEDWENLGYVALCAWNNIDPAADASRKLWDVDWRARSPESRKSWARVFCAVRAAATPPSSALGDEIMKLARELREKAITHGQVRVLVEGPDLIRLCNAASTLPVVPEEVMNIAEDYVLGKVLCGGSVFYRDAAIFARFIVSLGKEGANNGQS